MLKTNFFKTVIIAVLFLVSFKSVNSQTINHWEMVVTASDTWHYFPGKSEPPANWANTDFNAGSWSSGPGGIGYGDGDDGTTISAVPSVYLRINFNLTDTSNISSAILDMDYDDGFVAYLNGHEIARANIGTVGIKPLYTAYSPVDHEAQLYSGGVPERFMIRAATFRKYIIEGTNVLAVQVHNFNSTSSDMSSNVFLSVGIKAAGFTYRHVPAWFHDPNDSKTNLPIILIDTKGQTILDEPKITSVISVIDNGSGQLNGIFDEPTDYYGKMGIEIRGQSSQMFPKKGYGIELRNDAGADSSVSLLGMPSEADWVLSAPYSDKSMLRNAITYELGRKMGPTWQPRYKWCEIYLNGNYNGVYMLIEKIKRDANRVDINKLKPDEISGDNLTGGYIVKADKIADLTSAEYFYTYPTNRYYTARNYAFTYVYPKYNEIVSQQNTYIKNYLTTLENTLNGSSFKDPVNGYRKYMDLNSFVDFQIINELANNVDGYRYSTFFYKKKDSDGGKLFAGPLWDFDLGFGNVNYSAPNLATDTWLYPNYGPYDYQPMHWWARLMEDEDYRKAFSARWKVLRAGPFSTDSIMADLDNHVQYLGEAISRNFVRWPILGQWIWPNYFIGTTYQEEVNYLKSWITARLNWMDGNVSLSTGELASAIDGYNVSVFPNPVKDQLNIVLTTKYTKVISIEIMDMPGKKVYHSDYSPKLIGSQNIQLNLPHIIPGYYILKVKHNGLIISTKKLIITN